MSGDGTATENFKVGTCPCCHVGLYINVDIATEVRAPRLSVEGIAVANVTARITAAEIEHHCTEATS